ncbi:MAG: DUF6452 family protein [Polaribacter sp.]
MKKTIVLLGFILLIITSCEKDDFCLQNPVTPNLVITFFDDANRLIPKDVERLSIIALSKTANLITNITTDSIAIPLNSLATETVYKLTMNNVDGATANDVIATFTIKYTPKNDYVSRSCGFRVIFDDVSFSADNSWIKNITPTSTITNIDNQNSAHVQIFH